MTIARYFDASKHEGDEYLPGVPLRDITEDEYDALPTWLQASVDASPFYRKTAPAEKPARKAQAEKE